MTTIRKIKKYTVLCLLVLQLSRLVNYVSDFLVALNPNLNRYSSYMYLDKPPCPEDPKLTLLRQATNRSDRFPSIEERVRVYMADWYYCPNDLDHIHYEYQYTAKDNRRHLHLFSESQGRNYSIPTLEIRHDALSVVDAEFLQSKKCTTAVQGDYCRDFFKVLQTSQSLIKVNNASAPLLVSFGDVANAFFVPHFTKVRAVGMQTQLQTHNRTSTEPCVRLPMPLSNVKETTTASTQEPLMPTNVHGIVSRIRVGRHFGPVRKTPNFDIPWNEKKNQAVFRGKLTGNNSPHERQAQQTTLHDAQKYLIIRRCAIILHNLHSDLVDAKSTGQLGRVPSRIPYNGTSIRLLGRPLGLASQLQFKALIMPEGNDVASGLKWALYSNSVVIMPEPTRTTWGMEELLVPWKHYIPMEPYGKDAHQKMQWVLDHEDEAQMIARRATLWMEDLLFHPDAQKDDQVISRELIRRYFNHFPDQPGR
ncbi:lipopolysaccharide core biosynthesis protein [Seminavis robusta]|uniref:Lipopolysaccharide core biosynthesis protein n=1 Tax=Seminavis robusta TaxID=568900 RepID=A0A9N8DK19_9STRA|nr:lipopolysaccharide core biosynthesis protein [Seminavis robusta]|eukprot:Sro197_g083780.1 lipopolysaccharide core biosynthesis protein (477) ;mRNA; r:33362-34792